MTLYDTDLFLNSLKTSFLVFFRGVERERETSGIMRSKKTYIGVMGAFKVNNDIKMISIDIVPKSSLVSF